MSTAKPATCDQFVAAKLTEMRAIRLNFKKDYSIDIFNKGEKDKFDPIKFQEGADIIAGWDKEVSNAD